MERFSEEFVLCMNTPDVISDNGLSSMPEVMWDAFLCGIYRMKRIENYRRLSLPIYYRYRMFILNKTFLMNETFLITKNSV